MNMVAEGVKTSRVVMELADEFGVEMPIASEVYAVCHEQRDRRGGVPGPDRQAGGWGRAPHVGVLSGQLVRLTPVSGRSVASR